AEQRLFRPFGRVFIIITAVAYSHSCVTDTLQLVYINGVSFEGEFDPAGATCVVFIRIQGMISVQTGGAFYFTATASIDDLHGKSERVLLYPGDVQRAAAKQLFVLPIAGPVFGDHRGRGSVYPRWSGRVEASRLNGVTATRPAGVYRGFGGIRCLD